VTATALHDPHGTPWCHFRKGFWCVNGDACQNPNHRYRPETSQDPLPTER